MDSYSHSISNTAGSPPESGNTEKKGEKDVSSDCTIRITVIDFYSFRSKEMFQVPKTLS
jgi:hypothetical protein